MSDDDAPLGGFYYTQAIWALAPRNLRKTYAKIYNHRYGRKPPDEFEFPTDSPLSNLRGEFDAWDPIMEGFRRRRNAGEIIGFGHPDTAAAPQQEIPLNEWRRWLRVDSHPYHSTFSGGGRIWYRVEFYTRQAVETWRRARRAADDDKGALETRKPDAPAAAPIADEAITREYRGRKQKYNSVEFMAELTRIIHDEGVPPTQAELEQKLLLWCENTWGEQPSIGWVRPRISKVYHKLRPDQ